MGIIFLSSHPVIHDVPVCPDFQGQPREHGLGLRRQLCEEMVIKFIKKLRGGMVLIWNIYLFKRLQLRAVKSPYLVQGVIFLQVRLVAAVLCHTDPAGHGHVAAHIFRIVPEILPGNESAPEVFMGRRRFIHLFAVFQPQLPLRPIVLCDGRKPLRRLGRPQVIPYVSQPQDHPQAMALCAVHHLVQAGKGPFIEIASHLAGLEFPPRDHQDQAVETVGSDPRHIFFHVFVFAVPVVNGPFVSEIRHRSHVFRNFCRLCFHSRK